jgi:hypothetical protein
MFDAFSVPAVAFLIIEGQPATKSQLKCAQ